MTSWTSPTKDQTQDPTTDPVNEQDRDDDDPGQLENGQLVTLSRHAREPTRRPSNAGGHVAKHLVRVVQGLLGACIVVDVERDVFEGRGLLGERGKEGIVLPLLVAGRNVSDVQLIIGMMMAQDGRAFTYSSRAYASDMVTGG